MGETKEVGDLPEGEKIYLKKGWDGYRVVYPNRLDLSKPIQKGNINWKNFIGQWHFWVKGILILIALYFFVQMYLSDTQTCREFVNNIDTICVQYQSTLTNISQVNQNYFNQTINLFNLIPTKNGST